MSHPKLALPLVAPTLVFASLIVAAVASASPPVETSWQRSNLATTAHALPVGADLRIADFPLNVDGPGTSLVLQKFRLWKPGAKVTVVAKGRSTTSQPPRRSYFRGTVDADPSSFVFASVDGAGQWRGLITLEQHTFVFAGDDLRRADLVNAKAGRSGNWSCANDALNRLPGPVTSALGPRLPDVRPAPEHADSPTAVRARGASPEGALFTGDVAVETDWEFFDLFASEGEASAYVSDLMGAIAAIFLRDIDTLPQLSDLYLYTEGAAQDPWSATNVVDAVFQVRDYWQANRSDVERSTVHFLTGKNMGGGVAFIGSLCDTALGYGVNGEVSGTFDPGDPTIVSDIFTSAHELGHSFGSDHTHCYNGVPTAGDPPIDMCWGSEKSCYAGPTSLPDDGGSILSYCSLQGGGLSNVSLYLGRKGFYGERSERVQETMVSYLESVASCLPELTNHVFSDGFESAGTTGWSAAVGNP